MRRYRDRTDAGQQLAALLSQYANSAGVQVLALPRGGVPVAFPVAEALGAPLDVFVVRKLGVPGHEELAIGAIATGEVLVLNGEVARSLAIPDAVVSDVAARELQELRRRERAYRGDQPPPDVRGKTVILIDDGMATGSSMRAATVALRRQQPARLVIAVPVGTPAVCDGFRTQVDEVVCARTPDPFVAVGFWYDDFSQTTDEEVHDLLARAATQRRRAARAS
jgi:predicted phosphoribosyltransferase